MDNELSHSITITITMMVIGVVIGILSLFIGMSNGFGRGALATIADTQAESYASELINTSDYGAVPAASVYVMLKKNVDAIHSISGTVENPPKSGIFVNIHSADDLTQLFDLKVKLTLSKYNNGDFYDVEVGGE